MDPQYIGTNLNSLVEVGDQAGRPPREAQESAYYDRHARSDHRMFPVVARLAGGLLGFLAIGLLIGWAATKNEP